MRHFRKSPPYSYQVIACFIIFYEKPFLFSSLSPPNWNIPTWRCACSSSVYFTRKLKQETHTKVEINKSLGKLDNREGGLRRSDWKSERRSQGDIGGPSPRRETIEEAAEHRAQVAEEKLPRSTVEEFKAWSDFSVAAERFLFDIMFKLFKDLLAQI